MLSGPDGVLVQPSYTVITMPLAPPPFGGVPLNVPVVVSKPVTHDGWPAMEKKRLEVAV
jgi:hypothetical protein